MHTSDWSNISKIIDRHQAASNAGHHSAVARGDAFLRVQGGAQANISQQLNQQIAQRVERNRMVLKSIVEILVLMGRQNIAIRGHTDEESNFNAMLTFRS